MLSWALSRRRRRLRTDSERPSTDTQPEPSANGGYVDQFPTDENALDLFATEWATRPHVDQDGNGSVPDDRIAWFIEKLGSIENLSVLELGPLEAAQTRLLEESGAGPILAVEANKQAFLRCLAVKNLLGLEAKFMLGDFQKLLGAHTPKFDLILASGVLYHLSDPLQTLLDMMHVSDRICIWTHYFEADAIAGSCEPLRIAMEFPAQERVIGSDRMTYHPMAYGASAELPVFRGGVAPSASWIELNDLVALFARHGYRVETGMQQTTPNGPCACIVAFRQPS